jgi:hypothetical protein
MILSAATLAFEFLGLAVPAFLRRPRRLPRDFREDVAVSIILDEWCNRTGTERSDPATYATICRIQERRATGLSLAQVRSEILP